MRLKFFAYLVLVSGIVHGEVPSDWRQLSHGGLSFAMPADWLEIETREVEGQWGILDKENRQSIGFAIARERRPERTLESARKDGMNVEDLGPVMIGSLPGTRYRISGSMEGTEISVHMVVLKGLLSDGDRISFNAAIVGLPVAEWLPVAERLLAGVEPTGELISTLQGRTRHELFDGLVSLKVRNNWEQSDYSDNVSWEPPLLSLYGARFLEVVKGYSLTGSKGLLSKIENRETIEETRFADTPAWRIVGTGAAVAYETPMRREAIPARTEIYLSKVCLAKGDRFGYAVTATEAQLKEHRAELDRVLASMKVRLPEDAGRCDELVESVWRKDLRLLTPRSWRKDQDSDFHLSWYDKILDTGADIKLYISHGAAENHPLIGEGYPPVEKLETLSIGGYPATHYRKTLAMENDETSLRDYYVLDPRMRYKAGGKISSLAYLYFEFSTQPSQAGEADVALNKKVLDSVVLGERWESETPVGRVPRAEVAVQAPAEEQPGAVSDAKVAIDPGPAITPISVPEVTLGVAGETSATADSEAVVADGKGIAPLSVEPARARYEQAKALREKAAALQTQGDLSQAVARYRESLSLYPDERLETHVRRIEGLLNGNGD